MTPFAKAATESVDVSVSLFTNTKQKPISELLTKDVLGYTCVNEKDLDAAFINAGKGGTVPQTCLTQLPKKDCASIASVLGRNPTADECMSYSYRWLSTFDPDKSTGWGWDCSKWDCKIPDTPSPVPLPGAIWVMLSALGLLTFVRKLG